MGTKCLIAVIGNDGTGEYIRCNTDGYPEWVGRLLLINYPSREKAEEVISLGDLSCLGMTLDPKVKSGDDIDIEGTTAHHRDWGRDWAEVGPRELPIGFAQFDRIVKDSDATFGYVHIGKCWLVCNSVWHTWVPLSRVKWREKFPNPFDYPASDERIFKDCTEENLKEQYHLLGENLTRLTVKKRTLIVEEIRRRDLNPHDVL